MLQFLAWPHWRERWVPVSWYPFGRKVPLHPGATGTLWHTQPNHHVCSSLQLPVNSLRFYDGWIWMILLKFVFCESSQICASFKPPQQEANLTFVVLIWPSCIGKVLLWAYLVFPGVLKSWVPSYHPSGRSFVSELLAARFAEDRYSHSMLKHTACKRVIFKNLRLSYPWNAHTIK